VRARLACSACSPYTPRATPGTRELIQAQRNLMLFTTGIPITDVRVT